LSILVTSIVLFLTLVFFTNGEPCGFSPLLDKSGRIINGEFAEPGSWPWQLEDEVRFTPNGEWNHNCGASLISPEWAVSATHCFGHIVQPEHRAILGQHNRAERTGNEQIISFTIDDVILHEDYDPFDLFANDIALIHLPRPVDLTPVEVGTICLPFNNSDNDYTTNECWASGWGLDENNEVPDVLKQTDMDVLSTQECRVFFGSGIRDIHVCSLDGDLEASTCTGDSGGPLQCIEGDVFELVGALSFGAVGCPTNSPSAFARVREYLDWIEKHSGVTRNTQI